MSEDPPPPPYPNQPIVLLFSTNSVHDAVITGAGYTFEVITPPLGHDPRITSVYRQGESDRRDLVGEIEWNAGNQQPAMVRMRGGRWMKMVEFVKRKGDRPANIYEAYVCQENNVLKNRPDLYSTRPRMFRGSDGKSYQWEFRNGNDMVASQVMHGISTGRA
jgi:hypothetical protein